MRRDNIKFGMSGSAYLSVLLVVLLSGILGVGLITFALVNLRTSADILIGNDIYYKTEASIATVLAEVEKQVRIGQETAKEDVQSNRDAIMAMATFFDLETGIASFDEQLFKQEYERFYCDSFNQYMTANNRENGKKAILALKDFVPGIVEITVPEYNENLRSDPLQDLFITVDAQKTERNVIKNITAKFQILRESEISIKKVIAKMRNPIWMRAVTAEADVIATGGRVIISSYDYRDAGLDEDTQNMLKRAQAIYAWGTNTSRSSGSNNLGDSYGGIIAGVNQNVINSLDLFNRFGLTSGSGSIKIIGETVTDAYIHTFGSGSSIDIDVDNARYEALDELGVNLTVPKVFAESIQTEEFSSNNSITIKGDAMVKDDLELNGIGNNTIDINGSFLGISSGPDSDLSNDKFANRSSSIAYNDISESSTINIGKYVVVSGVAYNSNVTYQVDPYKDTPYKTGESIGLGENHKIYRYYFDGEDYSQFFDSGFKLRAEGEFYDYPIYSGRIGAPPNSVGDNRVKRFKDYLIQYGIVDYLDYQPNLGNDIINIGRRNGNRVEGYSLGVLPANGSLYYPLGLSANDRQTSVFQQGLLKAFDYIFGSDALFILKNSWEKRYNKETWLSGNKEVRKNTFEFPSLVDTGINFNANEIDYEKNIILRASSGDLTIDMSTLNGMGGLILARGNIVISGSGSFKGAIAAGGSVVFKGSGEKEIIYNEYNVLKAIFLNENVRAALSKGGLSEVDPGSVEIELKARKNVKIIDYREVK